MSSRPNKPPEGDTPLPDLESTVELLARYRQGDESAIDRLFMRYLPKLQKIIRVRLPRSTRDISKDTNDFVHNAWVRALEALKEGRFEYRDEGSFLAFLYTIVKNLANDERRKAIHRARHVELLAEPVDLSPSPLEDAIGSEAVERFDSALEKLKERHRVAIILKIGFGYTAAQIAEAMGDNHPNTAGMRVRRAILRLAEILNEI